MSSEVDFSLQIICAGGCRTPHRAAVGTNAKGYTVELNRNQYFFLGVVILLIGLQVRVVSSYILTDEATRFLAERTKRSEVSATMVSFSSDMGALPNKVINPPEWLGWCLISVGSVLILHSLAMKKPGA